MKTLFELARECLQEPDPDNKVALSLAASEQLRDGHCSVVPADAGHVMPVPGRPSRPELVHHTQLASRKLSSPEGRAAFIHALAHIEFNAINLGWDAVCRFRGMPAAYYRDWAGIAAEEALHFSLLARRLDELGYRYGDFPAHDGLWEMATKTAHDVLLRMALVPRVLEARGLDVTPAMIRRLHAIDDTQTAEILERIYADEIGHVEKGSSWFRFLCDERGIEPSATFRQILLEHGAGLKSPFNNEARQLAGFDRVDMQVLEEIAAT